MDDVILRPRGELLIFSDGKLIRKSNNLVVNIGTGRMLDLLCGITATWAQTDYVQYWNIGNGVTTPALGDLELASPAAARTAVLSATRSNNILTLTGSANSTTYNQVWSEFGLFFRALSGSGMFNRTIFDPYTKVSGSVLDWIFKISI